MSEQMIDLSSMEKVDDDYKVCFQFPDGSTCWVLIPNHEANAYYRVANSQTYGLNLVTEGHYC